MPTPTSTKTATPTLTPTPTPTKIPVPQGLSTIPEGYSAVRNPDGTWGYGKGEDAQAAIPNLTVDATGAHLRLEKYAIDIPVADIQKRIQVGQEGALQIYDFDNSKALVIAFAWNAEQNTWIRAADVLEKSVYGYLKYINVQTRAQLEALFHLEKLVLPPFPGDTYFPAPDKVLVDYMKPREKDSSADFNFDNPFGKVTELSKSPFRFVNYIFLEKGEDRKLDTYIVTEQVYNPADGSFSLLHFGLDTDETATQSHTTLTLHNLFDFTKPPIYWLPEYLVQISMLGEPPACELICNEIDYFRNNHYFDDQHPNAYDPKAYDMPEIERLIGEWVANGKVPSELESMVLIPWVAYIMTKP